jgi:hypothetical protein
VDERVFGPVGGGGGEGVKLEVDGLLASGEGFGDEGGDEEDGEEAAVVNNIILFYFLFIFKTVNNILLFFNNKIRGNMIALRFLLRPSLLLIGDLSGPIKSSCSIMYRV